MTRKILQLIALALAGYIVFELFTRWRAEKSFPQAPLRPIGRTRGAALTGPGEGAVQRSTGPDGSNVSERVGRGVVRRGAGA